MSPIPESTSMNFGEVSVSDDVMILDHTGHMVNGVESASGVNEETTCTPVNESVMETIDTSDDHKTEDKMDSNVNGYEPTEKVEGIPNGELLVEETSLNCSIGTENTSNLPESNSGELSVVETSLNCSMGTESTSDLPENNCGEEIASNSPNDTENQTSVEDNNDQPIPDGEKSPGTTVSSSPNIDNQPKSASETSDYFSASSSHSSPPTTEDSNSCASEDSNVPDLPQEVIDEERKFAQQTELDLKSEKTAPLNDRDRQKRYKTLMSLLGKSSQYATYMSRKLTTRREMIKEAATAVVEQQPSSAAPTTDTPSSSTSRKRKNNAASGDENFTPKKAKISESAVEQSYDPKTHYKNPLNFVVSRRQPPLLVGGAMRDYQLDGLEWMTALYTNGVNGILADEMGLGKTIQTIGFLCHLREKRVYGPHLIIGPLSTLPNWLSEFANFAPDVPVALFHGPEAKRNALIQRFCEFVKNKDRLNLPIIITSYEMPIRDPKFLAAVQWRTIIVDEGHRLKNYQTMLARQLRRYKTEFRLLLTGTPLQNNLTELWSLLNYLIPEIFDNLDTFENLFDFSDLRTTEKQKELIQREKEEQLVSKMHQILEPFLLRRIKADVNIALPGKKEIVVKAPMTTEQLQLYKSVIDRSISEQRFVNEEKQEEAATVETGARKRRSCARNKRYSEDWDVNDDTEDLVPVASALPGCRQKQRVRSEDGQIEYVFNVKMCSPMMMLRKIANHPYLVKTPVVPGTRDIVVDENLIQQSGKLLVLDALLPRLKEGGHKVLLFSAFKILLDLIEDYVLMRGYKYVRFDGSTDIEDRLTYIRQFNTDPETFIFLITTRAGGLGVNLTGADTVIIYDSDWNPQVDLQAQDRCHRIGQWRPVVVYRLLTAGTVDEYIMNTAVNKRRLEKLVVKKGKFQQQNDSERSGLDLTELKELMESNDYEQIVHPNGLVLSDDEIERLLDRSDLTGNGENKTPIALPSTSKAADEEEKKVARTPRTPRTSKATDEEEKKVARTPRTPRTPRTKSKN